MRSNWEVLVAQYLDKIGEPWEYEPQVIILRNGQRYTPDFKLSNGGFIEVKGYVSPAAYSKLVRARKLGYVIHLWNSQKLRQLGLLK